MSDAVDDQNTKEVPQSNLPNFVEIELEILKNWKKMNLFKKVQDQNKNNTPYVFLEGPPTANGMPHMGHALTRVIKDSFLRFHSMRGRFVTPRVGGWDCHGLPVELEIEKKLGINSKEEIEKFGIAKFNELCKESVLKYTNEWIKMSDRMGFLLDMNVERAPPKGAYVTMTNNYIESVWWSLATLYEKNLLFRGHKIVPYCARCGTSLSSHELALGYKETKDPSIFIKFNVKNSSRKLLAWTTTPWTLISNLLLVVKKNADYAVVEIDGEELILAESLVKSLIPKGKIVEKMKGGDLSGMEYESLFPFSEKTEGKKHFVTTADFVTLEDGSGIVHVAPAFGEDDYQLCKQLGVSLFNPVGLDGKFTSDITPYAGIFVKDADPKIINDLKASKKLFKKTTIEHTYPFCWRCDSPLLYFANESWFVGMSSLRKNLVTNNNKVYWKPEHLKEGRFGNFIEEAKDWALSRSRYWGTPLPIWTCQSCNHEFAIGSVERLKELCNLETFPKILDLHRPFIDDLPIKCPKCDESAKRESYVIDTWYDSGSAFFAQWHYPFENKDVFEKNYPVDFITEAIDQTRGWFYTLLAVSTAVFDKPSYLTCLTMGHILAEDGSKMSKSKGNAISPEEAFASFGADAVRFYLLNSPAWKSTRFGESLVRESVRGFQLLIWNIYSFFETYTKLDDWKYIQENVVPITSRPELDQYALSSIHSLINTVIDSFEKLEAHKATNSIQAYLDNVVSNWWIRRSRRRFWDKTDPEHESAYQTLYEIIEITILLLAPITPFLSEHFYNQMILKSNPKSPKSIHLLPFPSSDETKINLKLEQNMNTIFGAVVAGRAARKNVNIKNRQPLRSATIVIPDKMLRADLKNYVAILEDELNVKKVEIVDSAGNLQSFQLSPNFATLGPKFRKESNSVLSEVTNLDDKSKLSIIKQIRDKPNLPITVGKFELASDDFKIKIVTHEGFQAEEFKEGLVLLNIDFTDSSLVKEGLAKDIIRRIQSMRKDLSLEYDSEILIKLYSENEIVKGSLLEFKELISSETLSKDLMISKEPLSTIKAKEWEIVTALGEKIALSIQIDL
jgi:isoleucyl-tRNA synthetase